MTDNAHTHDGIDTDAQTAHSRDGETRPDDRSSGPGGGGLLRGVGAALLGLAGLGAASGAASAAGTGKRLLVLGDGRGKHTYEIEMQGGGSIQTATHAEQGDSIHSSGYNDRATGELWHWNVDSYTYSGRISKVSADGNVSFHFLDGGFDNCSTVHVRGDKQGKHTFAIATDSGDVDLRPGTTEDHDSDDGPGNSEEHGTPDVVNGKVFNTYHDSYQLANGTLQNIRLKQGAASFSRR